MGLCFFCWVPSWGAEWISIVQLKQSWRGGGRGAVCWVCSVRLGPQPGKEGVGGGERLALAEP